MWYFIINIINNITFHSPLINFIRTFTVIKLTNFRIEMNLKNNKIRIDHDRHNGSKLIRLHVITCTVTTIIKTVHTFIKMQTTSYIWNKQSINIKKAIKIRDIEYTKWDIMHSSLNLFTNARRIIWSLTKVEMLF